MIIQRSVKLLEHGVGEAFPGDGDYGPEFVGQRAELTEFFTGRRIHQRVCAGSRYTGEGASLTLCHL